MPCAISALTVASAVVMRTAALAGDILCCLAMMVELGDGGGVCRSLPRCRGLRVARDVVLDKRAGACAFPRPSRDMRMHRYRTHACGALRASDIGKEVRLSGWCHRIRDHGGVLFIDLRDHYGIIQVVADPDSPAFKLAETLRSEWVVRIDGKVRKRPAGTDNPDMPTGAVEVFINEIEVLGPAVELPMPVFGDQEYPEEIRLKYRFLDLRRARLHNNDIKRGQIIDSISRRRHEQVFFEFQPPLLPAYSLVGARGVLVP